MKLFFSVQLGHLKLSGYGLLSTQGVQNRSQNCWIVSQSEVMLQYMRDPGAPAELGRKGVKQLSTMCVDRLDISNNKRTDATDIIETYLRGSFF